MARIELSGLTKEEAAKLERATARARGLPSPLDPNAPPGDEGFENIRGLALLDPQEALKKAKFRFTAEVRQDLEAAAEQEPEEWICAYKLCDVCMELRRYGESVLAGERALKLRPTDPRS